MAILRNVILVGATTLSSSSTNKFIGLPESIAVELIKLLPSLLWYIFVVILCILFYRQIKHDLIPKLSGFKVLGVEATFTRAKLDRAIEKQQAHVSENDRSQVIRRAAWSARALAGMHVLWVDDYPDNNVNEVRLLKDVGITIEQVKTTNQALYILSRKKIDAVISDIQRGSDQDAGLKFLNEMYQRNLYRWTILYTGTVERDRGTPAYAFGITDRPDHLLHYLIDIAERQRL
ncbi:DNA-binding transcriptional response regulator [Leptothoe spongobia]|uniref:Response regulatory domain-containing protein n=1 Tax=Leptothoe spongobia TAU-MAC 1115 TaxID=1967444 RepID=A0A947DHP1_9CYAN|nr:hypothetical protein [Leptothoe spongobia]MBT9317087.1 hypothetical protein [Leptothoe spongobia TAU-MAC 1115]